MLIAVVVAYRSGEELSECCEGLATADEVSHIIVVNNSFAEGDPQLDATSSLLSRKLVRVTPSRNLGYAAGNNLGVSHAAALGATTVLVCNPDIVINPDAVRGLLREMDESNLDLISPYLLERNDEGVLEDLRSPGWDPVRGRGVIDVARARNTQGQVPTFFGACFVATIGLLNRVGPLSEDLFLYGEEIDYCMRMEEIGDCGWRISDHYAAHHSRGASISPNGSSLQLKSEVSYQHAARSAVIVGRRYWPRRVAVWTGLRLTLALGLLARGRFRSAGAITKGIRQGWLTKLSRSHT